MTLYTIRVAGTPLPTPRPKARALVMGGKATARVYVPDKVAGGSVNAWRARVAVSAVAAGVPRLEGPLVVRVEFTLPRPKSHRTSKGALTKSAPRHHIGPRFDLDNGVKAVLDALNTVAWDDDGQVTNLTIRKQYDDGLATPGAVITIQPLEAA